MILFTMLTQIALDILSSKVTGNLQTGANLGSALIKLISVAQTIYKQELGQPLDVTKIKPYEPV